MTSSSKTTLGLVQSARAISTSAFSGKVRSAAFLFAISSMPTLAKLSLASAVASSTEALSNPPVKTFSKTDISGKSATF